jgi:hypothetical protein
MEGEREREDMFNVGISIEYVKNENISWKMIISPDKLIHFSPI